MVRPPKNIQWWWSPQKPLKICNGLFTFLDPRYVDLYALEEDVLQRIVEDISRCYLIFHSSLKYLDMILSSFGDMILTRDSIVNLKTIVDHCPQNFENHRKTIGSNGWTPKKHSMVMVQLCQNHWKTIDGNGGLKKNINHSIALKNWPSLWSTPIANFETVRRACIKYEIIKDIFRPGLGIEVDEQAVRRFHVPIKN